ncbi:MAG TPA: DUF1015 domain-containing protein [Fimbriimonadaceae bacterium]|jgi:uncharacterized protein (DUF1015 family)
MATIRPFKGLRFSDLAGALSDLVAPPYDVLSKTERDELASKGKHNVVHLTLPEQKEDDRSKYVKYARSAADLAEWRREGALACEKEPTFYRYRQSFKIPGSKETYTRTALIALIKVEDYSKGVVLPHEQTFPKHKEDRLRILEATRSHLECIFGLFEDDGGEVFRDIEKAPSSKTIEVATDDDVEHKVDLIQDPAVIEQLSKELEDKKVWIADGHHRYETACSFRAAHGEKEHEIPEDYMMMALSSMSDPGLVLLPTHRIVKKMPIPVYELEQKLQTYFSVRKVPNHDLLREMEDLADASNRIFGVALPGGMGLLLTLDDLQQALHYIDVEGSDRLKLLDVTILHELIFGKILGLHGLDFFSYTRDPEEALAAVEDGADAAFLMNPPSVEDMRQIALGGEKMPQKSTYYYPKILSGLVLWSLNDFK